MAYTLKYIGADKYPDYFEIPTYYEIVRVNKGIAKVEKKVTVERLLKEGFILIDDDKETEKQHKHYKHHKHHRRKHKKEE